jgi:hypothetical protein
VVSESARTVLEGFVRARVVASAALAAVAALVLAGCNFVTPIATLNPYDPSDGVSTRIGDVDVLNALVISEDGESGNLVLSAVNTSDADVTLLVQYESDGDRVDHEIEIDAHGRTDVGGFNDSEQLFLTGIDTAPGGLLSIYFQYGDEQGKQLGVPVLDASLPQYGDLTPETPTPTPTAETPSPTETPAP